MQAQILYQQISAFNSQFLFVFCCPFNFIFNKFWLFMQTSIPDFIIIVFYLIAVTLLGLKLSGKQNSVNDYFLGARNISWWAVCLSVVATETSTLTFISIPAVAYLGDFTFLQLAMGYILGRTFVAWKLLPAYFEGKLSTVYELLQQKYGTKMRLFTAGLFQITRLLADGVRLFATSIPLHLLTGWDYSICIILLTIFTIIYTLFGGIKAVIWVDVTQTFVYIGGAIIALIILKTLLPEGITGGLVELKELDKLRVLNLGFDGTFFSFWRTSYTFFAGLLGGAFLSMASHGTDHLIVQRLLCCKSLRDAQKALVFSGFLVFLQFSLFLFIGSLLYIHFNGAEMVPDTIFPRFILEYLPVGIKGIIIAGIFAAAMSTLSSSINALAASSHFDFLSNLKKRKTVTPGLHTPRILSFAWGTILAATALFFRNPSNPVVELGLAIASYTYGGVLGVFLLSIKKSEIRENTALVSLWSTLAIMVWFIGPKIQILIPLVGPLFLLGLYFVYSTKSNLEKIFIVVWMIGVGILLWFVKSPQIAWPWYVPFGVLNTIMVGNLLHLVSHSKK
jgi:solute:Na+ symporter, SSS family